MASALIAECRFTPGTSSSGIRTQDEGRVASRPAFIRCTNREGVRAVPSVPPTIARRSTTAFACSSRPLRGRVATARPDVPLPVRPGDRPLPTRESGHHTPLPGTRYDEEDFGGRLHVTRRDAGDLQRIIECAERARRWRHPSPNRSPSQLAPRNGIWISYPYPLDLRPHSGREPKRPVSGWLLAVVPSAMEGSPARRIPWSGLAPTLVAQPNRPNNASVTSPKKSDDCPGARIGACLRAATVLSRGTPLSRRLP